MNKTLFPRNTITAIFLWTMATVFLLLSGPEGYTDISRFKYLMLLGISACFIAAMAGSALWQLIKKEITLTSPRKLWQKMTAAQKLMLGFWLCCGISAVISGFFPDTLLGFHRREGFLTITIYVAIFLLVSVYGKADSLLLTVFAVAVTVFSAICFLQFLGHNPFTLYPEGLTYYDAHKAYRYEFLGTMGNVDIVAALLSVAAPLFLTAVVRLKDKRRFLLLIPLACILAVTVLSKVAAAFVGVFGSMLLITPLALITNPKVKKTLLIVLLILLILAVLCLFCFDIGTGTLHEIHQLLHGNWDDDFGTGRLFIWRNLMPLIEEHPLFGGGCDTLGERMTVEFRNYDEETGILRTASIDTAHNEYLNILVNEGALALIFYLAALVYSFYIFIRKNPRNPAVAICGSGVLGYCLQAFFGIRMTINAPLLFILWALMLSADESQKKKDI